MKEMLVGGVVVAAVCLSGFFAPEMNLGPIERVDPANGPLYSMTPAQGRAYDRAKVDMQNSGAVMKNLPQMQKDAMRMHSEISKMESEYRESAADLENRAWLESDALPE